MLSICITSCSVFSLNFFFSSFYKQRKHEQAFRSILASKMNITEEQSQYILSNFSSMKNKEDFLSLLNYAKVIIYGEKAVPFALKHINYHSNSKVSKNRYTVFSIKKK